LYCNWDDILRPADITDGFTQTTVLDHVFDGQRLDAYDLVLAYEPGRKLVQKITAPVSDTGMNTSDFEARLFAVLRAFAFLGVSALGFRQFPLILVEELGIAHDLTRRRGPRRT
jgi:hypothetical protein